MKKFIAFLLVFSFILVYPVVACQKSDRLEINEVTHSIFYCPLYLAIENDYFEEEGLKVNLTNGGGADSTMAAVLSGSAHIGLAGPESVIYVYNQGKKDYPKVFGQLTQKDGSFLVSRVNEPNFTWSDLENKEIITGRKGGVPAMTFEYVCNQNGLFDGTNVTLNTDVAFNLTVSAFEGGTGDYCTMFEPTASEFVAANKGYIVASVGEESGEVPYTSFFASQQFINDNPTKISSFLKAIKKAYDYIATHTNLEVANIVAAQFPSSTPESLAVAIGQYKSINAWTTNLQGTEESFTRLQDILENSNELTKRVPFNDIVDNSFAKAIFG